MSIGILNDLYHSYRSSFLLVVLPLFLIGLLILFFFDYDKALEQKIKGHEDNDLGEKNDGKKKEESIEFVKMDIK